MALDIVILAAGKGTRMRSSLPKVLHELAGRPLLRHVIDSARDLQPRALHVVIGNGADTVRTVIGVDAANWVLQVEQLGTGHAMQQALPSLDAEGETLILYGDVPLLGSATMRELAAIAARGEFALLTVDLPRPDGYGRILRNEQEAVTGIVEHRDATPAQRSIREVNTGIMAIPTRYLRDWLHRLDNVNSQREYYLTDVVSMAVVDGVKVSVVKASAQEEVAGVNDRVQLAHLERYWQQRRADELMLDGVTLLDPQRFDLRGTLRHEEDVLIDVNVVLEGEISLERGVKIGPNCVLRDCVIGEGSEIKASSVLEGSRIGRHCSVGPFARLRPGTVLADHSRVGNFVETKKAHIGEGSKVNHLSYVGDAVIGRKVNVGAGTITCNYDGVNKSQTRIGDGAFIGSNTALVAPVEVGRDATVAAGSVITSAVPEEALAVARGRQRNIDGWKRPRKKAADS